MSQEWRDLIALTPWEHLEHAFGPAIATPADLMALSDPEEADGAFEQLGITVLYRDALYSATFPAMEIVAAMAVAGDVATSDAFALLEDFAYAVAVLPPDSQFYEQGRRSIQRIQATILPLIGAGDDVAVHAIGLQGILGQLPPEGEATLDACQARNYPVALAAFRALVRAGKQPRSMPADWRFAAVGAWMRLLDGRHSSADLDVLVRHWDELAEVVNVGSHLPWENLTVRNPAGALELYRRLPGEAGARGLLEVVFASRSLSPAAEAEVRAKVSRKEVSPRTAVALLQHLAPTRAVCDALDAVGFQVARPRDDVDDRADVAAALAAVEDPRWENHLRVVLETNPRAAHVMVSGPSSSARLGYAFGHAPVTGSWRLAQEIGNVLREEWMFRPSDGVEALLWWLANWGGDASKAARPGVLVWLEQLPGAVGQVLASWGEPCDAEVLRPVAGADPKARVALAKLSGKAADWRAVLSDDLPYLEAEVLRAYPQPADSRFVTWASRFIADTGVSLGEERVLAMKRLVQGKAVQIDEMWPLLLDVIDAGSRASAQAADLAKLWIRNSSVTVEHQRSLFQLLGDVASNGRGEWPAGRAVAASAIVQLEGRWPADSELLSDIVEASLAAAGEHTEAMTLLVAVARLRDPAPRQAALAPVERVLASDQRLLFYTSAVASDEAERAQLVALRRILAE